MSTQWILEAFKQKNLVNKDTLSNEKSDQYPQDNRLFVCTCCNEVWQKGIRRSDIDSYKDFPTIGKKRKRMPGH